MSKIALQTNGLMEKKVPKCSLLITKYTKKKYLSISDSSQENQIFSIGQTDGQTKTYCTFLVLNKNGIIMSNKKSCYKKRI